MRMSPLSRLCAVQHPNGLRNKWGPPSGIDSTTAPTTAVSNEPSGFILTTLLGIAGSFVATYLGQALGWYQAGQGAGLIGAVVGAVIVLVVWGFFAKRDVSA